MSLTNMYCVVSSSQGSLVRIPDETHSTLTYNLFLLFCVSENYIYYISKSNNLLYVL